MSEKRSETHQNQQGAGQRGKAAVADSNIELGDHQCVVFEVFVVLADGVAFDQDLLNVAGGNDAILAAFIVNDRYPIALALQVLAPR